MRVVEPFASNFAPRAGHLVASERVLTPRAAWNASPTCCGRSRSGTDRQREEGAERIRPVKGLAVFASDNISSSAYATEEIMRVAVVAGVAALAPTLPLTFAIVAVLLIVVTSYRQTIRAYPSGGGSYIVASDNLGAVRG